METNIKGKRWRQIMEPNGGGDDKGKNVRVDKKKKMNTLQSYLGLFL